MMTNCPPTLHNINLTGIRTDKFIVPIVILIFSVLSGTLYAQSEVSEDESERRNRPAIAIRGGTLGAGIEITKPISRNVSARALINGLGFSYDVAVDDIDYKFDIDLQSAGVLLDWHPFDGAFYLSAGGMYNGKELDAQAKTQGELEIGDTLYSFDEIGILNGDVDFDDFAPYLGIGWSSNMGRAARWGILIDVGVLYLGTSHVVLSTTNGQLLNTPMFLADLKKEEASLQDAIDDFGFYPVLSLGISYTF